MNIRVDADVAIRRIGSIIQPINQRWMSRELALVIHIVSGYRARYGNPSSPETALS